MKIMITGANGFLGQHVCNYFSQQNAKVFAVSRGKNMLDPTRYTSFYSIDLTDEKAIKTLTKTIQPDIILHTAAMSKPDICEMHQEACILNNVTATKYVAEAANDIQAHLIFASTDFIFGEGGPHREEDTPNPLNFYGKSKLMAEEIIQATTTNYTIFRPVFMYGKIWEGVRPTFLHWVKNNLEQHQNISVVSDQLRTPTYVIDICKGLEAIIHQKATGIYHLGGKEILSPYEMAIITANKLGLNSHLIQKVTASTFPERVKRAKHSGVIIDKAMAELHYQPVTFEKGVELTFHL